MIAVMNNKYRYAMIFAFVEILLFALVCHYSRFESLASYEFFVGMYALSMMGCIFLYGLIFSTDRNIVLLFLCLWLVITAVVVISQPMTFSSAFNQGELL